MGVQYSYSCGCFLIVRAALIVELRKMKSEPCSWSYDAVRKLLESSFAWAAQSAAEVRSGAVPCPRPRSSGGCWFRWDFCVPARGELGFPQRVGARNAIGVRHLPSRHQGGKHGACRACVVEVWGQRERRYFHANFLACLCAASRPQRPWQPSVLGRNPRCGGGQCCLFPTSEDGVRVRGFPVPCYGGAASLWPVPSGTIICLDSATMQVLHVSVSCVRSDSLLLMHTCFVPRHAAVAKDKLHPYARSSALR
ncbi:hypothetical protein TcBrA4_0049180 [Trypanosoma cruzi]|nr:hypothetical protein TcBrA4_0049180 [Trypanosoma cruzi]